jgi:acyl-CoA thioesterase I
VSSGIHRWLGNPAKRDLADAGDAIRPAWSRLHRRSAWAAAFLITGSQPALPQQSPWQSPAEACLAANQNLSLGASLPQTATRLKSGQGVNMVVLGSSSTVGLWVLNSAATYPEVMRRELARLLPHIPIQVINSGRIGDTVPGSLARLQRDVISHHPHLVIWQLGTNDVAWGGRTDGLKEQIVYGVRTLKASGADVILMDLQYAPGVLASSQHAQMQAVIAGVARQERVGLFQRFNMMRRAIDAGLPSSALVSFDMLHNSAAGYDCIGRALARAIHATAR